MYRLRELERKDIPIINSWRNDKNLIQQLGAPFRYINLDVDNKWYDNYMINRNNSVRCAIVDDQEDIILGLVSLVSINYMNQSAELHIMIGDKNNQGKGLGTYAFSEIIRHAFMNLNLNRIESTIVEDNNRSRRLCEKMGFVQEGVKRSARYKDGIFVNMVLYSIIKDDYLKKL